MECFTEIPTSKSSNAKIQISENVMLRKKVANEQMILELSVLFNKKLWTMEQICSEDEMGVETTCWPCTRWNKLCVFYRKEDKRLKHENSLQLLSEKFETLFHNRDRSAKIRSLVKQQNQLLDSIDPPDIFIHKDQKSKLLSPEAGQQLQAVQRESFVQGLFEVNN